jgi:hypothetical protein
MDRQHGGDAELGEKAEGICEGGQELRVKLSQPQLGAEGKGWLLMLLCFGPPQILPGPMIFLESGEVFIGWLRDSFDVHVVEEFRGAAIHGSATLITSSRQVTKSAKIAIPPLKAERASDSEKVEIGPFQVWLTRSDPFGEGKVLTTVNVTGPKVEAAPTGGSTLFDAADDTGFPTSTERAGVSVVYPVQMISVEVTDANGKQVSINIPEVAAAAQADGADLVISVRYWTGLRERLVTFKKEADDS